MRIGDTYIQDRNSPINPLNKAQQAQIINDENEEKAPSKFDDLLSTIWSASNETSRAISEASKESSANLLIGEMDNLPEHMILSEKSSTLFELNLTVRNKVLDAYAEIMKTQV